MKTVGNFTVYVIRNYGDIHATAYVEVNRNDPWQDDQLH